MHVIMSRPSAVHVRLAGGSAPPERLRRRLLTALDLVVRGFLVGLALGIFVASEGHAITSIVATGIAAIGIALVSWQQ